MSGGHPPLRPGRAVLAAIIALAGCGPAPVAGGTPGVVRAAGQPLRDVEVTIHRAEGAGWAPVGSAISGVEGTFALHAPGAAGPLWLAPGEYRVTLASAGGEPVAFPREHQHPETTPLRVTVSSPDDVLELDAPHPTPLP